MQRSKSKPFFLSPFSRQRDSITTHCVRRHRSKEAEWLYHCEPGLHKRESHTWGSHAATNPLLSPCSKWTFDFTLGCRPAWPANLPTLSSFKHQSRWAQYTIPLSASDLDHLDLVLICSCSPVLSLLRSLSSSPHCASSWPVGELWCLSAMFSAACSVLWPLYPQELPNSLWPSGTKILASSGLAAPS